MIQKINKNLLFFKTLIMYRRKFTMKKKEHNILIVKKSKRTLVRAAALSALVVSAMTITAFAEQQNMAEGGFAYLNSNYSNGMRNVSAGTIRGNSTDFAYLSVTTTYQNGEQYTYESSITRNDQTYSSDYEWSEDYTSVHMVYSYSNVLYDKVTLAES